MIARLLFALASLASTRESAPQGTNHPSELPFTNKTPGKFFLQSKPENAQYPRDQDCAGSCAAAMRIARKASSAAPTDAATNACHPVRSTALPFRKFAQCVDSEIILYASSIELTCSDVDCPEDCVMGHTICGRPPGECPLMPYCMPYDSFTCEDVTCAPGETCVMQEVVCVTEPCYPVPECIAE
ncbi:unnamed protein product [Darwinula stevensoni]|uniref:Uncharacterized protein n=1 Tax=Darwinula stevensoni TaxID=69355 RepID=A0A7R9A3U8_9CRUS|nr:unnamed protein product [Darwinula stevensoni]CAG0888675.1 unnamed protein product [Darwinula stevensoni]